MIKRTTWTRASSIAVPMSSYEAASVEPLSSAALASHCQAYVYDSNSAEAKICMSYIQGLFVSDLQPGMQVVHRPLREQSPCSAAA